jgi:hypothetical protein
MAIVMERSKGVRENISTGLTIHKKLFLPTIGHSGVSLGPVRDSSESTPRGDPDTPLEHLTTL